jgi:Predicted transcriptional regulators
VIQSILLSKAKALPFGKVLTRLGMEDKNRIEDLLKCRHKMLPVIDALAVLEGRWKIPIIIAIGSGNNRFNEIVRVITGITDKSLSKELKQMVEDQLIERIVHNTFPPKVEYRLTEHAKSLSNVISALREWGLHHRKHILGE